MEIDKLVFNEKGLIPAIIQDHITGQVLMLAYMNRESLQKTLETGHTWFYSRSREELWEKGRTSGNIQTVKAIRYDCDGDCLLVLAEQRGVACHRGSRSCFSGSLQETEGLEESGGFGATVGTLYGVVEDRRQNPPADSYTGYLFSKGIDKILKKVGEESTEVVIAAKNTGNEELIYELSDLFYHLTVLMVQKGVKYDDINKELKSRFK